MYRYIQFAVTAAISVAAAAITSKACATRWNGNLKKIRLVSCLLTAGVTICSMLLHGFGMHNIQAMILSCTFLYASYGDMKTHEADDFVHIIVLAAALISKPAAEMPMALLSAVILGGILLLVTVFVGGAGIGGADIKFTAACAFLTSLQGGLVGLGIAPLPACSSIRLFAKRREQGRGFRCCPIFLVAICSFICCPFRIAEF